MENLTAADVAAVTQPHGYYGGYGCNDGFGGSNGLWLFAILALMSGGGNLFGRNNCDGRCATVEDINNSANFTRLENQVQNNGNAINGVNMNLSNAICSLGYEIASKFGETNRLMSECCCGINRNIDGVRYEGALNTAAINANVTAVGQKILDRMCQDKEDALRQRINYLEMQTLAQPPRAVPAYTVCNPYTGNYAGFCGCGCGSNNI